MLSPRIRRYIHMQQIIMSLFGLFVGLVLSPFTEWFVTEGLEWWPVVFAAMVILGILAAILSWRKPTGIDVAIQTPRTIRSPEEAHLYARRGFVGFVPLYRPNRGSEAANLSAEDRAAAVDALDYRRLQVEKSNFQPTIEAITSHASRLEHCWLLTTKGHDVSGSAPYAGLLAAYLREEKGLACKFHYGDAYTIALDDDPLVLSKTYDQVQSILKQASRLEIEPQDLVADFTTGFRSMTLGMVLACLNKDQDLEFVGTRYNELGEPGDDLFPIIFSFEPLLSEKK